MKKLNKLSLLLTACGILLSGCVTAPPQNGGQIDGLNGQTVAPAPDIVAPPKPQQCGMGKTPQGIIEVCHDIVKADCLVQWVQGKKGKKTLSAPDCGNVSAPEGSIVEKRCFFIGEKNPIDCLTGEKILIAPRNGELDTYQPMPQGKVEVRNLGNGQVTCLIEDKIIDCPAEVLANEKWLASPQGKVEVIDRGNGVVECYVSGKRVGCTASMISSNKTIAEKLQALPANVLNNFLNRFAVPVLPPQQQQ